MPEQIDRCPHCGVLQGERYALVNPGVYCDHCCGDMTVDHRGNPIVREPQPTEEKESNQIPS